MDAEGATASEYAVDRDAAAVDLGDVLDDREAEASPAEVAAASLVDAVEALEEPRQVLARDPLPLVGDAHDDLVAALLERDDDGAALGAVLHRVVDEVDDGLLAVSYTHLTLPTNREV